MSKKGFEGVRQHQDHGKLFHGLGFLAGDLKRSVCHEPLSASAFSDNFLRNKHFHESLTVSREHVKLSQLPFG